MPRREILDRIEKFIEPFRVTKGKGFRLKDIDPDDTRGFKLDKGEASDLLQRGSEWLAKEQDVLYAQDRWSLLLVFQAMDAAGKDGTIKHVMSGVNPQGCQVFSFKPPSPEDLDHDFLWRYHEAPARARPHRHLQPLLLRGGARGPCASGDSQGGRSCPPPLVGKDIWDERLADIAHFEDYLARQGDGDPQVLPARLAQGAEEALPGAARRAREELEVLGRGRARAPVLGRLHGRLRGGDPRDGDRSTRPGTSCPRTTSGSPGSSWRRRSWRRSRSSTSTTRR